MSIEGPKNNRLELVTLQTDATITDALRRIDAGAVEIALMVDHQGRLIGTVTDGDVRRALLNGRTLDGLVRPAVSDDPIVVSPSTPRNDVLDLMRSRRIAQVPIVDDGGRLTGLHVLQDLLGHVDRDNWAVIMAGGHGSRLGRITKETPKPMLRVAGRPVLERLIHHLVGSGIRTIYLAINHLGELIEEHFGDGRDFGCAIRYLREERQLGTAGALGLLPSAGAGPGHPVLVMNGDLVTQFSVASLLGFHEAAGADATVAVKEHTYSVPFGVVTTSQDTVTGLEEKPSATWLINAGVYVLDPDVVSAIRPDQELDITELLRSLLEEGRQISSWHLTGDWEDIGQPDDLMRARGLA